MLKQVIVWIKGLSRGLWKYIRIGFLFTTHLILLRKPQVAYITTVDRIVQKGNFNFISLSASGCHRIHVSGIGNLHGKTKSTLFLINEHDFLLEITFHGVFSKIRKSIRLKAPRVDVIDRFDSELFVPAAKGLGSLVGDEVRITAPSIKLPKTRITSTAAFVHFPTYDQESYLTDK